MNRAEFRKTTREVAKNNGVSVAEVRREMQAAIAPAYVTPNAAALAVPRKGDIPTTREFIGYYAGQIKAERQVSK